MLFQVFHDFQSLCEPCDWHEQSAIFLFQSHTMVFLPVRGDNPRALASGLSHVQAEYHGITNSCCTKHSYAILIL